MEAMATFDQKLGKLCRKRRWKQAALMNAVNDHCRDDPVSKSTVSRWLNGENKPFDQWALALARALDVPLDYLADDAQEDLPCSELKPDERSLVEIYRGFRDNEGMTLEEARDRLMARTAEAMERLLTWVEGGRDKAAKPADAPSSEAGKPGSGGVVRVRDVPRRKQDNGDSPGVGHAEDPVPGRPDDPVSRRRRK